METLPSITLQAFGQEFFKRYPRHWKPNTVKKNESAFRLQIAPYLGDREGQSIVRSDVEQWFTQLSHVKGSANQALVLLSVMMQQCETWEYRPKNTNPCRGFKRYKAGEVERYLSKDELRQLWRVLDTLEGDNPAKVMIIRLLIYTGCRSSEVRTLQWKEYRGGHWHLLEVKRGRKRFTFAHKSGLILMHGDQKVITCFRALVTPNLYRPISWVYFGDRLAS